MSSKVRVPDKIEADDASSSLAPRSLPISCNEYNILLLGETGVGKSTFINAFANYITHSTLQKAVGDGPISLIHSKFTVTDENLEERTIEIGKSDNESQEVSASAQNAKSYIFCVDNEIRLRLIDTPGIGDTRGADQDNINFEKMLTYLGEFKELHAICILLKPNKTRISVMFEYFIQQVCRLEKTASNIIFIFTNSKSTFYRPGDTLPALRKILATTEEKPPHVKIPLHKNNVFCIDNESFRFLVACVNGVRFDQREKEEFAASWNKSAEECIRLLTYISGLKPHQIQNTISINEARRLFVQLCGPLADLANLIQINLEQLERQRKLIGAYSDDVESLKKNMYIPFINIRVEELSQPRTVCTEVKCCDVYQVNGNKVYHYKQRCHDPCYCLRNVPEEVVGSPELMECAAMDARNMCKKCGCSYLEHMLIYYVSIPYEDKIVDENIKKEITTKETAKGAAEELIKNLKARSQEYKHEQDVIIKSIAKFAHFLENNALTTYNAFEAYLNYLIDRENSLGERANKATIEIYRNVLQQYVVEKKVLDSVLDYLKQRDNTITCSVSAKDIMETVQQLYDLPHCGAKLRALRETEPR